MPAQHHRHQLDEDGGGDVGGDQVGQQDVAGLGEEAGAVLDGGQDDHVEDGGQGAQGHLDEDEEASGSHLEVGQP